jgi:hypothetical protein
MCQRVRCRECGKPTWAGCGAHIEQTLAGVPREARCQCRESAQKKGGVPAAAAKPRRFFGLF